ncbi:pH-sensitive chloride channel 2 [Teleopsis dalmanni]|uniref:pH-sensitive chloride channel 2 n=1 Tax=Teleopsis dalmanni TaxID=139649 RepID=UPI0018CE6851|nr:pH-sensitive chloride channel 2 [Teleopsis dalmanni]
MGMISALRGIFVFILIGKYLIAATAIECPDLVDADTLSQTQLIERLTHGCRYDRLERPISYVDMTRLPVKVYVRAYIYFLQNLEAHDLQFKIHALLQFRFMDPRLSFRKVAPKRRQPILGEKQLRDTLWIPHIFLANERDSSILGTSEKDILTSISPDGTVIVSSRIKATLHCWMNLQKFPFDAQHCSTVLESWMYNTSELVLNWEQKRPITFDPALHLTEYVLHGVVANETIINADLSDLRHGAFAGNYSSLSFTMHLSREVGFYIMDYFLPSILIVSISWVSFWLQADQSAPRITLGTATLLTFITLASAQGKTLPKVSYIKVSEVWFLGCTIFIFGSLVEFAFVNSIWRRKQNVDVKKLNSRNILKSTLSPRPSRHSSLRSQSFSVANTSSSSKALNTSYESYLQRGEKYNNYMTVHNFPITTIKEHDEKKDISVVSSNIKRNYLSATNESQLLNDISTVELAINNSDEGSNHAGWTTLTPQEISMWIDSKARFLFPVTFLVFNMFFWVFVYVV